MIEHAAADGRFFYARAVGGFIRSWAAAFRYNARQPAVESVSDPQPRPDRSHAQDTPAFRGLWGALDGRRA